MLDFGLAKAMQPSPDPSAGAADAATATLSYQSTLPGKIMGTAAYMSPEQSRGQKVDKRSDVWAFGCCLYEALTGRQPFVGQTTSDLLASILKTEPDFTIVPPETSSEVLTLLRRCLEKEPRRRLRYLGDIALTLEETSQLSRTVPPGHADSARSSRSSSSALFKRWLGPAMLGLLLGLIVAGIAILRPRTPSITPDQIRSLAVLPFENLKSGDTEYQWLAEAMPDAIRARLGTLEELVVKRGRVSLGESNRTTRAAASELGVDALITGNFVVHEDTLQVSVFLTDAASDAETPLGSFNGFVANVFPLQAETAAAIANKIRGDLWDQEKRNLAKSEGIDPRAYAAFRKGEDAFLKFTLAGTDDADRWFDEALRIDPNYINAITWKSNNAWIPTVMGGGVQPKEAFADGLEILKRVIDLNPNHPDVLQERAFIAMWWDWDWAAAKNDLWKALELHPGDTDVMLVSSMYLNYVEGRFADARRVIEEAIRLDPERKDYPVVLSQVYQGHGRYQEAARLLEDHIEEYPDAWASLVHLSRALRKLDSSRALELAKRAVRAGGKDHPVTLTSLARAHLQNSDPQAAMGIVARLERLAKRVYIPPSNIALIHADLGDFEEAFKWLERGMEGHFGAQQMVRVRSTQWMELLGNESRYWSLIERMNFPALPIEHPFYEKEQAMRFGKGLSTTASTESLRLEIALAEGVSLPRGVGPTLTISPDGETVVYASESASGRQLYRRNINQYANTPITGTEGALGPRFSPNGDWVLFSDPDFGGVKKIPLAGGVALPVAEACEGPFWADDGYIYFVRHNRGSVWRVPELGGTEEPILDPASDLELHAVASCGVLPGGQALLIETGLTGELSGGIAVVELESKDIFEIAEDGSCPIFSPTGHILFARVDKMIAVPFDVDRLQKNGPEIAVIHGIRVENGGALQADVSSDGSLVYAPAAGAIGTRLAWVDRQGAVEEAHGEQHFYYGPRISPGGHQVAVQINEGSNSGIRILDLEAGTLRSLRTPDKASNPIWSADGKKVAFAVGASGDYSIQWMSADEAGEAETLIESSLRIYPETFSREGDLLVFREYSPAPTLFVHDINVEGSRTPILAPGVSGHSTALSHDGKWLAYVSESSGRSEVFVRPFPGPGGIDQISKAGGGYPVWGPNDNELFYLTGIVETGDMMVVSLQRDEPSQIKVLREKPLFDATDFWPALYRAQYAADPNGQRFLMLEQSSNESSPRINVVLDWFEELRRLAPTDD